MDSASNTIRKPFIDHISELRNRLVWVAIAVIVAATAAFAVNKTLLSIIQKPLHQTLYFTSPAGGLSFIFQLCITVGILVALPLIIYQVYEFVSPMLSRQKRIVILIYILSSLILAASGVLFAYFISLPAALHFLTQFGGNGIESLIKADEYFSFALTYIAGFGIMFQLPLLVLLINRVKPLGPGSMMKFQRWVILLSFIGAALITPTPDPINQALMAAPAIILYQVSIVLVMAVNRGRRPQALKLETVQSAEKTVNLNHKVATQNRPPLVVKKPSPIVSRKVISDFTEPKRADIPRFQEATPIRPISMPNSMRPLYNQHSSQNSGLANRRLQSMDGFI